MAASAVHIESDSLRDDSLGATSYYFTYHTDHTVLYIIH